MRNKTMKVYFASPFFNPEQVEREERLKAKLRSVGLDVWSPKESCHLKMDDPVEKQEDTFKNNIDSITSADIIFTVTDGKDMGTIWEAGFANGFNSASSKHIIVVYYCETLPPGGKFNVMLARSGDLIYTKFEDLDNIRDDIEKFMSSGTKRTYSGNIE